MNEAGVRAVLKRLSVDTLDELNGWVRSLCPFALYRHDGGIAENPNFGVSHDEDEPSYYNCFVCGSHGPLIRLPIELAKLRKTDLDRAKQFSKQIEQDEILGANPDFGDWDDDAPKVKENEDLRIRTFPNRAEFFQHPPAAGEPEAVRYLASRRIHFDTITKIGLRYDRSRQRILFPLFDYWTGRYIGHSGRIIWSEEKRKREEERATERALRLGRPRVKIPKVRDYAGLEKRKAFLGTYGRNDRRAKRTNNRRYWIICEGLLAYARFVQLGYGDVTLAVLGSKMTDAKAEILRNSDRAVYHFSDPDQGGSKYLYGMWNEEAQKFNGSGALDMLYGDVVQFLPKWPDDLEDVDDLVSVEQVEWMMRNAELYVRGLTNDGQKTSFAW